MRGGNRIGLGSSKAFSLLLCFYLHTLNYSYAILPDDAIDKAHKEKSSDCGKMTKVSVSSRISNAEESKEIYPWVIRIYRYYREAKGKPLEFITNCMGNIITEQLNIYY